MVIVRDRIGSARQSSIASNLSVLQRQTFTGEILNATAAHSKAAVVKGNVFACLATCLEDVEAQLRKHSYATNIWDMSTLTIWPMETVHTSPYCNPLSANIEEAVTKSGMYRQ